MLLSVIETKVDVKCTGLIFKSHTIKASRETEDKVLFLGKRELFKSIQCFLGGVWAQQV